MRSSLGPAGVFALALALAGVLGTACSERDRWASEVLVSTSSAEAGGVPGDFAAVDLFVDPLGVDLGAWQVEVSVSRKGDRVEIVGVEGGEHPSFAAAPTYDPRALLPEADRGVGARIVLAAFDTRGEGPRVETRVARLHLFFEPLERVEATTGESPRVGPGDDSVSQNAADGASRRGDIELRARVIAAAGVRGDRIRVAVRAQIGAADSPPDRSTEAGGR